MSIAIRLPEELVKAAQIQAKLNLRSVSKQIEYWCRLGKVIEENPDLPLSFIQDALKGKKDIESGNVSEFKFRNI